MTIPALALKSLWNRRLTALLTAASIAFSVSLLLAVERVRHAARDSFHRTVSGADLLVGARSGHTQLLLYSVFRMGRPTSNVSVETWRAVAAKRDVAWTIPISLGDSHRGFPVMGTNGDYFRHYRYAGGRALELAAGARFGSPFEAVVGAAVARELGYAPGGRIELSHGTGASAVALHADKPFTVAGVLAPTGTPVDRTVHIPLEGMEALHADWVDGRPPARAAGPGAVAQTQGAAGAGATALAGAANAAVPPNPAAGGEFAGHPQPKAITAFLVGLKSKIGIFRLQRELDTQRGEALSAVLPGAALQDLWATVAVAENALRLVSALTALTGLTGMLTALLTGLNERRREMAILRAMGAGPRHIAGLLVAEAGLLALAGSAGGFALMFGAAAAAGPALEARLGLAVDLWSLAWYDAALPGAVVAAALLLGLLPAWKAYRNSLADGLTVRL